MKLLLLSFFLFVITGCQPNKARFDFNKIRLTSFYYSDSTIDRDFHIQYYLECDSNGKCIIVKENSQGKQEYYQANLPSSFDSIIQKINFFNLESVYEPNLMVGNIYCGFPLCFIIEDKNNRTKYIRIIPYKINPSVLDLVKALETIAEGATIKSLDTVNLASLRSFIQKTFMDTSKLPVIRTDIKFTPPVSN
jgi:hypothetical protein